jgi:hypothetical protein
MAGETLEMNGKDALLLSSGLMDEEKYNQALPISLAIYEQRNKDYVVAGILSMKAYINIGNTKRAAFIGDEIKDVVQRDLVVGNESLSDWDAEMISYFYWTFVKHYSVALYLEKRHREAITYLSMMISHREQDGADAFVYKLQLASSCLRVGDFQCAEKNYLQTLIAAKKKVEYGEYEKGIYYNLACTETGLGEYKKVKDYLLSTGWEWIKLEKLITEDNDLRRFRDSEYFEQLRTKTKK